MESHSMWTSVTGFFHLAWYLQDSCMLQHIWVLHFFLLPNISLYGRNTFYLSIHLLMDNLGCFHFLSMTHNAAVNSCGTSFCVDICFYFSVCIYIPRSRISWSFGHMVTLCSMFWGTVKLFQSGCTILHSYQQCMRAPILHILANTCYYQSFWW